MEDCCPYWTICLRMKDFPKCVYPEQLCKFRMIDASCLTWEGQQFQGKAAIVEKLSSLPFQKIQHSITAQDHQPTPDSCILSMVVGQLKADEDPIMGFHQIFLLKNINDAWVCTNDMFRLALHNFG
ncbi:nuclear transport factor 2 isoform X3 [Sceloporus undulatus]|uniref:nuclear transport factor 2 isoform X3 n=1 Tax=Sceloporus undulatus TaxID=8520 RepID=UPI001C4B6C8A|nr:nuclear transport factor 2 isoform X3 [Sceloporus undulatus]